MYDINFRAPASCRTTVCAPTQVGTGAKRIALLAGDPSASLPLPLDLSGAFTVSTSGQNGIQRRSRLFVRRTTLLWRQGASQERIHGGRVLPKAKQCLGIEEWKPSNGRGGSGAPAARGGWMLCRLLYGWQEIE